MKIAILGHAEGWKDYDPTMEVFCDEKHTLKDTPNYRRFSAGTIENFPFKEVKKQFGVDYFTNMVCYMLAAAIMEDADEIHLYGVRQAGLVEYMEQRRGVEFWLGIAVGRGIKVEIHGISQLLKNSRGIPYQGTEKVEDGIKRALDLTSYMLGKK